MLDAYYRKRLKADLDDWQNRGWLVAGGRESILSRLGEDKHASRLPAILGFLGAVLLGFAAISFVAANWDGMSKLLRLILLFGAMWTAFGAAIWLKARNRTWFTESALLLGAALFGTSIMLISQIYHIEGHYPDAVFLWSVGALLTALLLEARGALALAFVLMTIWTGAEILDFDTLIHWPFLPVWLVATVLIWRLNWPEGLHLAFLSLGFWLILAIIRLNDQYQWPDRLVLALLLIMALGQFLLAIYLAARHGRRLLLGFETAFVRYGLAATLLALFLQQPLGSYGKDGLVWPLATAVWPVVIAGAGLVVVTMAAALLWRRGHLRLPDAAVMVLLATWSVLALFIPAPLSVWLQGIVFIGLAIWAITYGQLRHDRLMVNLSLAAFGFEVLYIYFRTFGTLLNTSVFFLAGGFVLVTLALALERFRRRLAGEPPSTQAGAGETP